MFKQVVRVVTIAFEGLEFDTVINQYLCVVKRELTVSCVVSDSIEAMLLCSDTSDMQDVLRSVS
jgi:hypothetical protein